jgi:hypothetical protein
MLNITPGQFVSLVFQAKGKEYGKAGEKIRYGNAVYRWTFQPGVDYAATVERSIVALRYLNLDSIKLEGFTGEELQAAVDALWISLSDPEARAERYTQKGIWAPTGTPGIKRRIDCLSTIQVRGLLIKSETLIRPPNGYWQTKSKPATLAKKAIERRLPLGKYRGVDLCTIGKWVADGKTWHAGIYPL